TRLDAGATRSAHPLIGRRAVLDRLARAFDGVTAGASAAVTLVGPAGIGKSHLAETALDQLRARARVVRSVAPRYTDAHPFRAIAEVLRALLGVDADATPDAVAAALRRRITQLDARAQAQDAFLSIDALLDPTATREGLRDRLGSLAAALDLPDLAAGIDPRSVAPAVRAFVEACAHDAPLVICFEDAHALCDASLAVVEELVAEAVDAPVFIVCVARPPLLTRAPQWGAFGAHARIDLGPLPPHEAEAVVRQALPGAAKAVVQALTARAAGNPLFLRELGLAHAEGDAALPATVGAVMQARIDRLPPASQTILRAAAIFGRSFWAEGAARLAGRRDDLAGVLDALAQGRFIEPDSPSVITGLAQWRFAQPLMQEVVLAGVGSRAGRALHARAALWLSDEVPRRDERLAWIARHLDAAGDSARAATLWLQAAAQATAAHAPAEAAQATRAALRADDIAPGALTGVRRAQAEADLAQFAFLSGALDEAAARLDRALDTDLPVLERAGWLRLRAEIDEARSALPEARARLAEVRSLLAGIDPDASAEVRHLVARDEAWLAIRDGAYVQADAILQAALTTVAPAAQASRASLSNLLGVAAAGRGEAEGAQRWYRAALIAARAADDQATVASICLNLGNLAVDHNDYPAGVEWYAQVIRARARQGNRSGLARAYGNLGTLHAMLAEYDKAARYLNEAIRIRARTGHVESAVYAANLGEVYLKQGRLDDAGPHLERAIEQCRSGTAPGYLLPDALRGLAELRLAQHAIDAAVDAAREALDLAEASGDRPHAGVAGRVLGDALARRGDRAAGAVLDAAIATLEALELPLELGVAYATRARHTNDATQAARLTAQARALLESVNATAELAALSA
ncbi:MAG: tetratricopeptide (TPR) repeat protein, partial [Bradymonadia bacterium]